MSNQCPFCHSPLGDNDKFCTNCGAPNSSYIENTGEASPENDGSYYAENTNTGDNFSFSSGYRPRTIEELKEWAQAKNLPLQDMRFFIGENYMSPRAFGIYREGDQFIVYKNKSDGSRAVRYKGKDEAYAVGELYDKMRDEIKKRKGSAGNRSANYRSGSSDSSGNYGNSSAQNNGKKKMSTAKAILILAGIFIAVQFVFPLLVSTLFSGFDNWLESEKSPSNGYYYYNDDYYYCQNGDWYEYDDRDNEWESFSPNTDFLNNYNSYYYSYNYNNSYGIQDFGNSPYYQEPIYNNNDNDNNYDNDDDYDYTWDNNDTWDAGGTDWDSDW